MAAPKLQLLSRTLYDTDGTQTVWDFNFSGGYLLPTHVKAYYENEFGFRTEVTVTEAMLIGEWQLRITPAIPANCVLVIYRSTPKDGPMVDFVDRGAISETALDTTARQAVFVAAEAADEVNTIDWNKIMAAATSADASATASAASATASSASAATASTASASAATYRNEANTARDTALAAVATAVSGGETLAALSQSLHVGTVVKSIVYDTGRDSDGGAWRKRCQQTSWYQEAVQTGKWLGQKATAAAAWGTSGAVTGDFFQNSTDGKYYALGASSPTVTEVFRGNTREFPAVAGIVAEASRVVIYDLATPGCPMWMSFVAGAAGWILAPHYFAGGVQTSVAARDGRLLVGSTGAGESWVDFLTESAWLIGSSDSRKYNGNIAARNSNAGSVSLGSIRIAHYVVNDVAITVLDGAPTDPATGLPVPNILVGTAGGVSEIQNDGTVKNSAYTGNVTSVALYPNGDAVYSISAGSQVFFAAAPRASGWSHTTRYNTSTVPALITSQANHRLIPLNRSTLAIAAYDGLMLVAENPSYPAKGMLASIRTGYNSGWQVGDSRLATLADTVAETVTASGELIANGAFATDTSGWTAEYGAALSVVAGALRITNDATGTNYGGAYQAITTVPGKTYSLTWSRVGGTGTGLMAIGNAPGDYSIAVNLNAGYCTFKAVASTTYIRPSAGGNAASVYYDYDNISCKLAEADRSVKANGMVVVGTLTKSAVATGAQLVAYSGFSASNYFEQPYSSNLDFGTGDFCVMGWMNHSAITDQSFFERGSSGAPGLGLYNSAGNIGYVCHATSTGFSTGVALVTGLHFYVLARVSGTLYLYRDGVQVFSVANTANITNASAILRVGNNVAASLPSSQTSFALWRIGATAPSADQIAKAYRDELQLFQPNAQCTIAGTSSAVQALAYDDATDLLHIVTSYGRTSFNNLVRVDSEATTVGTPTSVSAVNGGVLLGGTSARVYQPALKLRDELLRKEIARKALGKEPVFVDYAATASQTTFVAPKGYVVKAVYVAGVLKQKGTGKDYTVTDDGFQQSIVFGTGLSVNTWVSVMYVRA